MLTFSAADRKFPRTATRSAAVIGGRTHTVVRLLAENRWPFRLPPPESISLPQRVQAVNRDVPFFGLRWFFDAETVAERNWSESRRRRRDRGPASDGLPGRVPHQSIWGRRRRPTPPITKMLDMGIRSGQAPTRPSGGYNPWVSLYWMVAGKTVGGTRLYRANRLDRTESLRRYVSGAWFSGERRKRNCRPRATADLAVLSGDYFSVPEEQIKGLESVLTVVDGKVVYGSAGYVTSPPPLRCCRTGRRSRLQRLSPEPRPSGQRSAHSHALLGLLLGLPCSGPLWGAGCITSYSDRTNGSQRVHGTSSETT